MMLRVLSLLLVPVVVPVLVALPWATGDAEAQAVGAPSAAPAGDCTRWPGAVFDAATGMCACPEGMWWNLRGDACLPKEHAAGEFCQTVWPASQPFFQSDGGYRCVCAPPLVWNAEATACRAPVTSGEEDCGEEWPGTLPVLSPSGTEFECRCPGGRRWDEASRNCVAGAPVLPAPRPFYGDVPAAPAAPAYPATPPSQGEAYPGAATLPPSQGATPPSKPMSPQCEGLLAEIRAAAAAGDAARGDALGMKAAISGCDPVAISEAAKVGRGTR